MEGTVWDVRLECIVFWLAPPPPVSIYSYVSEQYYTGKSSCPIRHFHGKF